jgi:hypothetical protein
MQFLIVDEKQSVNVCEVLYQIASNVATFLSMIITGDKSRIYDYDPETSNNPPKLTETERGETGEQQSKEHVHNFL